MSPAAVTGPPIVITFPEPVPPKEATSAAENVEFAEPVHQFVAVVVHVPSPCCTSTVPVSKSQTSVAPLAPTPPTAKKENKTTRKSSANPEGIRPKISGTNSRSIARLVNPLEKPSRSTARTGFGKVSNLLYLVMFWRIC